MLQQLKRKSFRIFLVIIALILLLSGIGYWKVRSTPSTVQTPPTGNKGTPAASGTAGTIGTVGTGKNGDVSPLLFGTNMSLYDSSDQLLNSAQTRQQLQQMHLRIIRMPVRASLSNEVEIQAAQAIKNIGAIPLVVLRGAVDSNVLADDTRLIQDMNSVFSNTIVFYEYGNEEDLLGVDVNHYTASWNQIVPQLRRIALNGQFIGPVNYQYNSAYLTSFLQHANPRPNEISWHEYTCDDAWSKDTCISHIDNWTNHIRNARQTMHTTLGTVLPVVITEWNYAPNATPDDGKNNDSKFMADWTGKAVTTLAANRIFASMQYSCTNNAISLVTTNGSITTQGSTIQTLYQEIIIYKRQPQATG